MANCHFNLITGGRQIYRTKKVMNYTQQQIESFKAKAEKWDALEKKLIDLTYDDEKDEAKPEDESNDLCAIGEISMRAFKLM